jgi:diguanylate cyclase (GGDEF)-like protein/PAS domain S-box-containing protein
LKDAEGKMHEVALHAAEKAKYQALFENSRDAIFLTRPKDGAVLAVNPAGCSLFGYSEQQLLSMNRDDLLDLSDPRFTEAWAERAGTGAVEAELTFIRRHGARFEGRASSKLFTDESGCEVACTSIHDITERKQTEEALRQSEERFRLLYENAPLGIIQIDQNGYLTAANRKFTEISGYSPEEAIGLTYCDVTLPEETDRIGKNAEDLLGKIDAIHHERRLLRKDGSTIWVRITPRIMHDKQGETLWGMVVFEDISERKKTEAELKQAMEMSYHQANHDMLTGLANRASFNDRLKEALAYARRDEHLVAIHMLDLDRFKSINDTLGHHIGDLLLQEVAKRIKSQVRATDLAARLGGDEFVVIQTHLAAPAAAAVLAGKLVEELGRTYVLEGQEVHSDTSIGVAIYPNDAEDPTELLRHADLALYEAKHHGRFNYQFYRDELGAAFRETQRLGQELVLASRENEFCLHYQPQFDLKSGRITGIEALLRWRHPTRGMLAAAEFIQEAERAKLMPVIGEWALQTACSQHKKWIDSGLAVPLTLNLSSMQLRDPRFLQMLNRILEETDVPSPLLQLEMREAALWDPKLPQSLLAQMKERGLRLALDDFCAHMTGLSTLARFPLDAVKTGQRMMRELPFDKREATILAAVIDVAHNLKIAVCADRIETADQLAAVKEQSCDSVQGNLLSPPLDADEMKRRIDIELAH